MSKILQGEIAKIEKRMLALSARAEEALYRAIKAVETGDAALAAQVIESDAEIDRLEVELEEEGLKILALHQPVAVDLRCLISVLKINSDLERIADLATTIAKQARVLVARPRVELPFDLHAMASKAWSMVRDSLDSQVRLDAALARSVRAADKDVDTMHQSNTEGTLEAIRRNPAAADAYLAHLIVSRSLERVADHAKSIAADVVYMLEGAIVRHGADTPAAGPAAGASSQGNGAPTPATPSLG
jgi:phosphate transport system protein